MFLTYYGHSCFSVEVAGKTLLFDPFISGNELAASVDIDAIRADYILVSHGHADHIADAERIAKNSGIHCKVIASWEICSWFDAKGIQGHPMNIGGQWAFDFGTVHQVNAVHSSSFPDGSYAGNPTGFVVETGEGTFYYSGDTALHWDMKLIPMLYPRLKFAVLCLGDNFTMSYKHSLLASDFIECGNIIGCHFDTFGFIRIDHAAAEKAFTDRDKTLLLPKIGGRYDV
jgi:L-ascorbate metabolism protein UlaG (beta-lactamase superfamily)